MDTVPRHLLRAGMAVLLVISLTTLGVCQKYFDIDHSDSALYAYGGFVLDHGGHLYCDLWDHKPPGVYAIDALAFRLAGGPSWLAVVMADAVMTLAAVLACAMLVWRTTRQGIAAGITAAIAAFYLNLAAFHEGGGLAESYMIGFLGWAAYCFVASRTRTARRGNLLILSGVLAGLAILCKPTGGMMIPAVAVSLIFEAHRTSHVKRMAFDALLCLVGLSVPFALLCAIFAWQGTLREMIDASFLYNLSYLQHGDGLRKFIEFHQYHNLLLLPAGLIVLAAGLLRLRQPEPIGPVLHRMPWLVFLPVWLVIEWLGAYAGNYDNGQYMLGCILPLSCLTGIGTAYLLKMAGSQETRSARMTAVSSLLICLVLGYLPLREQWRRTVQIGQQEPPALSVDLLRAGTFVRGTSSPADRIWVWGYAPQVYLAAQRMPATRYVFDGPFLNSNRVLTSEFDEMLEELGRRRPVCIVDAATTGWFAIGLADPVPSRLSWQEAQYAGQIERLQQWVQDNYQCEMEFGELVVYRLRTNRLAQDDRTPIARTGR